MERRPSGFLSTGGPGGVVIGGTDERRYLPGPCEGHDDGDDDDERGGSGCFCGGGGGSGGGGRCSSPSAGAARAGAPTVDRFVSASIKSRVPSRPAVVKGFPKGATREEAGEVLKTLDGIRAPVGRELGSPVQRTNNANEPTCPTSAAKGGGACGMVKWIKTPETVKEDLAAQIHRWH